MCEWTATNLSTLKVWINFQRIFSNFAESDLLIVSMNCMAYFWAIIFCQYCTRIVNRLEASDWNCSFSNEKWNFCIEIKKNQRDGWLVRRVRTRGCSVQGVGDWRGTTFPIFGCTQARHHNQIYRNRNGTTRFAQGFHFSEKNEVDEKIFSPFFYSY